MSLPTPDEFEELADEYHVNQEQNDAYRALYERHEAAMERIEALEAYGQMKAESVLRLTARLEEQDLIIRGAAKVMSRIDEMADTLEGGDE